MTSPCAASTAAGPNTSTSERPWLAVAREAVWYHGCQQVPTELAALLSLLAGMVRPAVVLEIGAADGGSAWAWSQLPTVQLVVSVTLPPGPGERVQLRDGVAWRIIRGSSADPAIVAETAGQLGPGRAGMVFIDADHSYAAARQDWLNYGQLTAAGGLTVLHDINHTGEQHDYQVCQLWRQLAPVHESLAIVARPGEQGGTGILLA